MPNHKIKPAKKMGGPKSGPKLGFCHFLKFGSLALLEIAQDNSLEHCLTTSSGKTREKKLGCPNWVRN